MLKIQEVAVDMIRYLRGPLVAIERGDRDLGKQLRRAAASVVLNMGEGSGSTGGTRRERYRSALGSLREVQACLQVAEAFQYVKVIPGELKLSLSRVAAGLEKVAR